MSSSVQRPHSCSSDVCNYYYPNKIILSRTDTCLFISAKARFSGSDTRCGFMSLALRSYLKICTRQIRWPLLRDFISHLVCLVFAGLPVWIEVAAEVFPALVVVLVKLLTRLQTPLGHSHTERRLKHESLGGGWADKLRVRPLSSVQS